MAYTRRGKGGYKRKRRGRRKRNTFNKKQKLYLKRMFKPTKRKIAKAMTPKRLFFNEGMMALSSSVGRIKWHAILPIGTGAFYRNVLKAPTNSRVDNAILGSVTFASTSENTINMAVQRPRVGVHFRNVSNHVCFLQIYLCVARDGTTFNGADTSYVEAYNGTTSSYKQTLHTSAALQIQNSLRSNAMNKLVEGWDALLENTDIDLNSGGTLANYDETPTFVPPTYVETLNECEVSTKNLTPYKSKEFCEEFYIQEVKGGRMEPGVDWFYNFTTTGYTIDNQEMLDVDNLASFPVQHGGKSKFLLVSIRGDIGKDNAADNTLGWMTTDVAVEYKYSAKVVYVEGDLSNGIHVSNDGYPDVTGKTLEGPTVFNVTNMNL